MVKLEITSKKVLTKPRGSTIAGVSSTKALKGFTHSTGPLVREVEQKEIVQDNRSQFFKSELEKEIRGINKWLS